MTIEPGTTMREWEKRRADQTSAAASIELHNEPRTWLDRTCAKCGVSGAAVRYHMGAGWSSGCARDSQLRRQWNGEHLHIRCGTCGYEWAAAPLDSLEKIASKP